MSTTKDKKIAEAWAFMQKYPNQRTRILDKLLNAKSFTVNIDEFNAYDSTMMAAGQIQFEDTVDSLNVDELIRRAESQKEEGAPAVFSQVDNMSDDKILSIFEAKDDLEDRIERIGEPPEDEPWYIQGRIAEDRIDSVCSDPRYGSREGCEGSGSQWSTGLREYYDTKLAEEWEGLEYPFDPIAPLMGPLGFLTSIVSGGADLTSDFEEQIHERGFDFGLPEWVPWLGREGGTFNPLTGFGAWELAEFQKNPRTGQQGLSPELLEMESGLEELYGTKRVFREKMIEGGYYEIEDLATELQGVQDVINQNKLIDPRVMGSIE